jgi:hypothetical protein
MEEIRKKRRPSFDKNFVFLSGVILSIFIAIPAFGDYGYTYIGSPAPGEASHAQILSQIYGGSFTKTSLNYSNGTISALRVYDHDDAQMSMNLLTPTLTNQVDQIWTDGIATVTAEAKYASLHQSFGWNGGGGTGSTFHALLTDADIAAGTEVTLPIHGDFLWGSWPTQRYEWKKDADNQYYWYDNVDTCWHRDWPQEQKWWSLVSKNPDGLDHFVTYKIEGLGGSATVWMIFMEDLTKSSSDKDYNDFVVEISAIPEPATLFLLAAGVAAVLRRRSR